MFEFKYCVLVTASHLHPSLIFAFKVNTWNIAHEWKTSMVVVDASKRTSFLKFGFDDQIKTHLVEATRVCIINLFKGVNN